MKPSIEKGLPIPESARLAQGKYKNHVFHDLEIGDSYFTPADGAKLTSCIVGSAHGTAKRSGKTCVCRRVNENGIEGIRIWRTA